MAVIEQHEGELLVYLRRRSLEALLAGTIRKGNRLVKAIRETNDAEQAPSSTAATRMRLHRQRRRQLIRCVTIQLHELEVEALVKKGWLNAELRNDPAALVEALHGHLGYSLLAQRDT